MAENFNTNLELKDITESEEALAELMEKGGKAQTPFLVDSERNVSMYETNDIIDHLREFGRAAGTAVANKPRVHVGGATCVSCEG